MSNLQNFYDGVPSLFPHIPSGMLNLCFDNFSDFFDKQFSITKKIFPYPMNITNIKDKEDKLIKTVIQVALAGFTKQEIKVSAIKGKSLTLSIEPKEITYPQQYQYKPVVTGIAKRSATYTWNISPKIDLSDFKPTFKDGILTIYLNVKTQQQNSDVIIGQII